MPSLQRYSSHGRPYWRIVESYRRPDGKPTVRVLMHLGKAEDLLARLQQQRAVLRLRSVSAGAVDAAFALAQQLGCAALINQAVGQAGGQSRTRDGLSTGESLVAAAIARLVHPSSKRAIAEWAAQTSLPARLGVNAEVLTSQHFWDQMDSVPVAAIAKLEQRIVEAVVQAEGIAVNLVAYDTTNFFTHLETTNRRSRLAQRGHSKQRRHDLRQLGLALMVSEEGQIPLGHALYEGSRVDVHSFAALLKPVRERLRALSRQPQQLTLVFDQGAESAANLEQARQLGLAYVTALKPSDHRDWLAEDARQLEPVVLSTGQEVKARRSQRLVHGVEQTVVAVFSPQLYEGQRRGLEQHLQRALQRIGQISPHPREGMDGARRQVERIVNRQYVREVLRHEVMKQKKEGVVIRTWIDETARRKLEEEYFGLRLLATARAEWTTAQIIEAYRGQSRVERAFRDLKDPWVCAFRPQYHWTDQKLIVHALIAVLSLLLGRVLLRRAQRRLGYRGSLRHLIQKLSAIRTCIVLEQQPGRGRPQAHQQLEDCDAELTRLGRALGAIAD
jgi:transposase